LYDEHDIPLWRVLTDRRTEYCGLVDRRECELYLAMEDIDHTRTTTKSPQTNGICERFHGTKEKRQRRPVSRVLSSGCPERRSFL
jgi:hypothetical protein